MQNTRGFQQLLGSDSPGSIEDEEVEEVTSVFNSVFDTSLLGPSVVDIVGRTSPVASYMDVSVATTELATGVATTELATQKDHGNAVPVAVPVPTTGPRDDASIGEVEGMIGRMKAAVVGDIVNVDNAIPVCG